MINSGLGNATSTHHRPTHGTARKRQRKTDKKTIKANSPPSRPKIRPKNGLFCYVPFFSAGPKGGPEGHVPPEEAVSALKNELGILIYAKLFSADASQTS